MPRACARSITKSIASSEVFNAGGYLRISKSLEVVQAFKIPMSASARGSGRAGLGGHSTHRTHAGPVPTSGSAPRPPRIFHLPRAHIHKYAMHTKGRMEYRDVMGTHHPRGSRSELMPCAASQSK